MNHEDREAVRRAGAGMPALPESPQGLPERIEDPAVTAEPIGLLRHRGPNETADLVAEITRAYREHAEAAGSQDGEADKTEVLEDDPDCE